MQLFVDHLVQLEPAHVMAWVQQCSMRSFEFQTYSTVAQIILLFQKEKN